MKIIDISRLTYPENYVHIIMTEAQFRAFVKGKKNIFAFRTPDGHLYHMPLEPLECIIEAEPKQNGVNVKAHRRER